MAVTENFRTRAESITFDAQGIIAVYDATWEDWANNTTDLPVLGDFWDVDRDDLRCSRVSVRNKEGGGNVYCEVTANFTTQGFEERQERSDQVGSWQESMDFNISESYEDKYFDRTSQGEPKVWNTVWVDAGGTLENAPPLLIRTPTAIYQITTYGTTAHTSRIISAFGKVNSDDFLSRLSSRQSDGKLAYQSDTDGFDDSGLWMFVGAKATRMNAYTIRYDFRFEFDGFGWNFERGPLGTGADDIQTNIYATTDLVLLFDGMDSIEPEENIGLRG